MRRTLSCVVVFSLLILSASSRTVAQGQTPAAKPSVDEVLKAVRADLQASRADIMAKNVTLTAEQAAKFWPMFNKYQQEQNVLMDDQLKTIQKYIETFDKLDDAGALALMKAHFDRDTKMNTLRQQWLTEFQTVLPTKLAVRAIQIDRRLGLAAQMEIASQIPLVH